ncbi:MAG: hypothetical protein ACTSXA_04915 [Candidatus Heimdallarchaeota archaeon]
MIPNLTEDIVYCPKCGSINSFKKSKSGKMLNFFCCRCQTQLNDLWDEFSKGNIKPVICFYCDEITFKGEVYCIACGAKQQKVRKDRAEKLTQAKVRDHDLDATREGTDRYDEVMRAFFVKRV